jgi:hypothetical protein
MSGPAAAPSNAEFFSRPGRAPGQLPQLPDQLGQPAAVLDLLPVAEDVRRGHVRRPHHCGKGFQKILSLS